MRTPSEWMGMDPGGVTWLDLFVLDDPDARPQDRTAAIEWIADKWFRKPIAPQRFKPLGPRICTVLRERAEAANTTVEAELRESVKQALLIALDDIEDIGGIFAPEPRKQLLRRLNDLVVEDLLGPNWRRAPSEDAEALLDLWSEEAGHAELEAALDLDALASKSGLSEAETEVISALRQGLSLTDAAEKLGIKAGAARVRWHRAKQKLQAATGM